MKEPQEVKDKKRIISLWIEEIRSILRRERKIKSN
jgi:hypothetical protein